LLRETEQLRSPDCKNRLGDSAKRASANRLMTNPGSTTGVPTKSPGARPLFIRKRMSFAARASYLGRWLPNYFWQMLVRRRHPGTVHLVVALADHFEPSIVPGNGLARAPYADQERRLERWCRDYPRAVAEWRDAEGCAFNHTYFYPAEQYDKSLVGRLAEHCAAGWGEIEIHLHHGVGASDTAENTRRQLLEFRDKLASEHGGLCCMDGLGEPRYAFVHGNFALANSARGTYCGVDSEMQVLAETGCYADLTLPTATFHPAQIEKVNSLYECGLPLNERAPHRKGRDLERGRRPEIFPLMVQGPLLPDIGSPNRARRFGIENAALTNSNPPSLHRLSLWKHAAICVQGRPDWLFIKLHCHSMDPTQDDAVIGTSMRHFLRELVEGAPERGETLHFVCAREMVNIILAACDGREGNPGDYRDYRLTKSRALAGSRVADSRTVVKG